MYEGHLADGSGIQKHSAGGLYPYVVYAQGSDVLTYGVIVPGQSGYIVGTYDEAVAHASALKEGMGARTNGQCFVVGQTVYVDGQGINTWAKITDIHQQSHQAWVVGLDTSRLCRGWARLTSLSIVH